MIVVYYGINLSLSLPFCLSVSLLFPSLVLCLCPNPHFHFLHRSSINLFQPLPIPSAYSSGLATTQSCPLPCFSRFLYALCLCPNLHPPSLPLAIFLPFSLTPPLPVSQSRPSFSFSFSSGLYFSAPDVPPVAYIVFLPPPLDMAKETICALLAILEHFFEAFSPLDLFFALAPFRPVPRPFPAFLHPGCRRFPPLRLPSLSLAPLHHRAHQAPFCARGLLKNIAVSENAPGAHGDVPRAGGCSTRRRRSHASAMFHGRGAVVQAEALLVLLVSANVPRSGSPTRIVISN